MYIYVCVCVCVRVYVCMYVYLVNEWWLCFRQEGMVVYAILGIPGTPCALEGYRL